MRTSPVHYIAPSAISIVPNCNGSANDLAVTISRGAKIKVYCPRAGIDKDQATGEYQEWVFAGRNRRLADSTKPYTIYARLPKSDKTKGYVVFSPMTSYPGDVWIDKHLYLDPNTPDGLADLEGVFVQDGNWWVKLGDVSLPDANNRRTVTLDTGILGTDQFNDEWALRPDELPLRIELGCTIGDEDVGQTPYVYWGQSLVLTAMLTEGWTGTDIQRFDRWEIIRNSGDAAADNAWNLSPRLMPDGQITLNHARGTDDDFNGAVSVTFTILAVGHNADTLQREILKTATINIMAETVEKYELSLSETIVSYNPQTQNYTPSTGVNVGIRATDQRGEVFAMTRGQIANAFLVAEYSSVGSTQWTALTFSGSSQEAGIANIGREVFALQQSVNVRLMRRITADGQTAEKELSRTTIAFVRNGEDSKIREWIYRLNSNAGYDATTGTAGGTAVSGQTDGVDNCLLVDDFVPSGWSDDPTGVSQPGDVEWESWRDYDDENHRWGVFHAPVIHNRYAENGKNAVRIDLDNQADIIACTEDGSVRFTRIVTVHARIYDGDSPATAGVSTQQTEADMAIAGVTPTTFTLVNGLLTVTWQFVAGTVLASGSYAKDITLNYNGESYTAQFSLTSSNTSAVYQLHPNMSEVSFQVDANGSYTPPTQNIYCGYTKTDGGGTHTFPGNNIANLWREGGAPYNIFWRRQLSDGTFSEWRWTKDLPSGVRSIDSTTTDIGIEFAMSSANSISLLSDQNIIDRELVAIVKGGKNGPKGDDAQEVNPNILLRTIFDRGMPFVLEAWTRNSELIAVDGATDTIVNGRKSLRMNASALSQVLDFKQNVFGKVKPSTWYTLSFNYFATQSFHTFLYDASNTTPWIDLSEGYYIDGADTPIAVTRIDGFHEWPAEWSGNRHGITFKTASAFSANTLYVLFRCLEGGQLAICMPKLEEGRVATAYMAHEDDLKGDNAPYNEHAYALSRSRTSHADGDLYQVNGVRWFPSAPDPMATHPYVWERIMHYTAAGVNDQTSYICLTGAVGAMGKLCYMAGEYREDVEYTSNDSQTVAVEVSGTNDTTDIYYLNAESNVVNGTHIGPTTTGQTIWVQGMSQYNLVRARYLFADFAQFGAAVVSGDWLISVHGTINDTAYEGKYTRPATYTNGSDTKPTYFWFDPAYPNEDHAGKYKTPGSSSSGQWASDHHNFIPHYAVNLLTGKTYQNDAYVRGEVHATSGEFTNGKFVNGIFSGNLYTPAVKITVDNFGQYHIQQTASQYILKELGSLSLLYSYHPTGIMSLPYAEIMPNLGDFEGAEVRIVNAMTDVIRIGGLSVRENMQASGVFATWHNDYIPALVFMGDVLTVRLVVADKPRWLIMSREKNYLRAYIDTNGNFIY